MKRTLAIAMAIVGFSTASRAQVLTPSYKWDFNLTNSATGTNLVNSTIPGGNIQGPAAPTQEAIVQMVNSSGTAVNLLGLPGSGVGTNAQDRALLLAGAMGGSGPVVQTPAVGN